MSIGIDFDDVIADLYTSISRWHNENFGTQHTRDDYHSFYLHEVWGISRPEALDRYSLFAQSTHFKTLGAVEGAVDGLQALKNVTSLPLYVVTGRNESIRDITKQWIADFLPTNLIDDIHFANSFPTNGETTISKGELCKRLGIKVFIDDNVDFVASCCQQGISSIVFETPWNRTATLPANAVRARDWMEVVAHVIALLPASDIKRPQ